MTPRPLSGCLQQVHWLNDSTVFIYGGLFYIHAPKQVPLSSLFPVRSCNHGLRAMTSASSARLINLNTHKAPSGSLTTLTAWQEVPFAICRFFFIAGIPQGSSRGDHAHKTCQQFLFSITGSMHAAEEGSAA